MSTRRHEPESRVAIVTGAGTAACAASKARVIVYAVNGGLRRPPDPLPGTGKLTPLEIAA